MPSSGGQVSGTGVGETGFRLQAGYGHRPRTKSFDQPEAYAGQQDLTVNEAAAQAEQIIRLGSRNILN
jgi:hypothetical protein